MASISKIKDPATALAPGLVPHIFSYLNPAALIECCKVSSVWRQLVSSNFLWKEVGREKFGEYLNVPNIKSFLRECWLQQLKSNDEIVAKIQEFVNRISLGQNGRFRCILGAGRGHRVISVEVKGDQSKLHPVLGTPQNREDDVREFDIKDTAYASHEMGKGDVTNPDPSENELKGGEGKQLKSPNERKIDFTKGPFRAVLRLPHPLESETDLDTWVHFAHLENATPMEQKIKNVLHRKVVSLDSQNSKEQKEQNKRISLIGVAVLLFLGLATQLYLNYVSGEKG